MTSNWKILTTGLTGQSDTAPSMWIDQYGIGHCAWVLNGEIKYARFTGLDWETLGTSVSSHLNNSLFLSGITIDGDRFPMLVYKNEDGIWLSKWNGRYWEDDCGGVIAASAFSATITSHDSIRAFTIEEVNGSRRIICRTLYGESWVASPASLLLPSHDNDNYDLSAYNVGGDFYLFWRLSNNGNERIGHAVYDSGEEDFYGQSDYSIKDSQGEGAFSSRAGTPAKILGFSANMFFKTDSDPAGESSSLSTWEMSTSDSSS
jgi:uncharacterized membrane protein